MAKNQGISVVAAWDTRSRGWRCFCSVSASRSQCRLDSADQTRPLDAKELWDARTSSRDGLRGGKLGAQRKLSFLYSEHVFWSLLCAQRMKPTAQKRTRPIRSRAHPWRRLGEPRLSYG